ncbi:RnfABCDGE type electron transport complex subunit G [Alkaliphilus hydrothermalis]|uniref:Ion-translocating oxidoreductase complex subunit G n=1 Tax=Alkaliphilus hydrothermalis TaxID=1482730 RepID=A0ABS2NKV6_9FIRM|nr:RnfABCDGE type electron transport complex subunit G [Alkaliphilus hydrothermalis]MBM7613570.1 electron transport complex protein RnfG [Alkaliphilus hydrothermalis]
MRDIIRLGLILLLITSIAAFVLGMTNDFTKVIIQERAEQANVEAIQALLTDAEDFNKVELDSIEGIIVESYEGTKNGVIVGYTVKTKPQGYGGTVEVLVGMTIDGKISGVKVGEHTETPGLGSKIADASFIDQYLDKATNLVFLVRKDNVTSDEEIQAISGATISSEAVTDGVNAATQLFEDVLKNR